MVLTREKYNQIIQDVNAVLENPPSGCDPIEPLEEVGEKHRWAKSDIRKIHDAIKATCPDIVFEPIPNLWKQRIIDEIYAKLQEAWCQCECKPEEGHGATFTVWESAKPAVLETSGCFGEILDDPKLCDVIGGLTIAPAGVIGRLWTIEERRIYNDGHVVSIKNWAVGGINCDGTPACAGSNLSKVVQRYGRGLFISCFGVCDSPSCQTQKANAEQELASHAERYYQSVYILTAIAANIDAECAECE